MRFGSPPTMNILISVSSVRSFNHTLKGHSSQNALLRCSPPQTTSHRLSTYQATAFLIAFWYPSKIGDMTGSDSLIVIPCASASTTLLAATHSKLKDAPTYIPARGFWLQVVGNNSIWLPVSGSSNCPCSARAATFALRRRSLLTLLHILLIPCQ